MVTRLLCPKCGGGGSFQANDGLAFNVGMDFNPVSPTLFAHQSTADEADAMTGIETATL
jgi:hypothetical protein